MKSDGIAVAPARAHRGHLRAPSSRCSTRRASWSTTRRSTSAARRRTTGSATWPRSSGRSCPGSEVTFADGAGARHPQLPGQLRQDRARPCRPSSRAGRCASGVEELYAAYRDTALDARGLPARAASCASSTSGSCRREGALDADLRRSRSERPVLAPRRAAPGGAAAAAALPLVRRRRAEVFLVARRACRCRTRCCAPDDLDGAEPRFPLDVAFCPGCSLVQILEEVPPEQLFVDNYLYFSSFSDGLCATAREHALRLIDERRLGRDSLVVEIACNDGYLLQELRRAGHPGARASTPRPTQAAAAEEAGVPTLQEFFGAELAAPLRADGQAGRRDHRQQRHGARADAEQLRRGAARSCSRTTAS